MEKWKDFPVEEHLFAQATAIVKEIKGILEDKTLDDPTCFDQIEAILGVYYRHGLEVNRHTELD